MAQWFYAINSQQYGPVPEEEIRGLMAQGKIGPADLLWSEGMANWQRADSMFPATAPAGAPVPPPPPYPAAPGYPPPYNPNVAPHRGTMILVFGILGLVCCIVFAIIAWVMGNGDLQAMREGRMDRSGESITNAGRICGMIGTILGIIGAVGYMILAIAGVAGHHRF